MTLKTFKRFYAFQNLSNPISDCSKLSFYFMASLCCVLEQDTLLNSDMTEYCDVKNQAKQSIYSFIYLFIYLFLLIDIPFTVVSGRIFYVAALFCLN